MTTAESGLVTANNRIQENTNQIVELNEDLSELSSKTPSVIEVNKIVSLNPSSPSQYVTATVDFSSDIPAGKNYEILSARSGVYPLPFHNADFTQHTWIFSENESSKMVEIKSNAKWPNQEFIFEILIH
jgi:hypothetical protein